MHPDYHSLCKPAKPPVSDETAKSVAASPERGICVHLGPDRRWPGCIAVYQSGIYEMPLFTQAEVEHGLRVAAYYWGQLGVMAA